VRSAYKRGLAAVGGPGRARGATVLIYHRVGGGTSDERDVSLSDFVRQLDVLEGADVVTLDDALRRAASGDDRPCTVLTFDDGFVDVHDAAWPLLTERRMPFLVYLSTAYVGGTMHWDGSTATAGGPGLSWSQLEEMVASGWCTVGNHTHSHCRPERLTPAELDSCSDVVERRTGRRPRHFAWTWGIPVPSLRRAVEERFASAATGRVGRVLPGSDPHALNRVPVRRTDPLPYFRAVVQGSLAPATLYDRSVRLAKRVGARG
jgi:peptidoglycan/xylan/chitin deacetylase (PgdA/CDA1 family)